MVLNMQLIQIAIAAELDIITARRAGGKLVEQSGFNKTQKYCVMTSISELASNIIRHAGSGSIDLKLISRADGNRGIEVIAFDQGQGIADVNVALQDGYSTGDGLGGGLSGVMRMMSEMAIESGLGKGTVIRAVKWINETQFAK